MNKYRPLFLDARDGLGHQAIRLVQRFGNGFIGDDAYRLSRRIFLIPRMIQNSPVPIGRSYIEIVYIYRHD